MFSNKLLKWFEAEMSNKHETTINPPTLTSGKDTWQTIELNVFSIHQNQMTETMKTKQRKKSQWKIEIVSNSMRAREMNWRVEIPILSATNVLMGPSTFNTFIVLSISTCLRQACGCFELHTIHNNTFVTFAFGMYNVLHISFCSTFWCFG